MDEVLNIEGLSVYYKTQNGESKAVDRVSLTVYPNEMLGIAGESGSGKSTLVGGIMRLIKPPGYVPAGRVLFTYRENGREVKVDLLQVPENDLRKIRWRHISYIPQGSMNSLNPVTKIKEQMTDVIMEHSGKSRAEANALIPELLRGVDLRPDVAEMYPHELSGGMKQRVIIAMALALEPELVIADEPTTALDVVNQLSVLSMLFRVCRKINASLILITHDMAVHAQLVDRVAIMYAGRMLEVGYTPEIFRHPLHPYTEGLLTSIPSIDIDGERKRLEGISGLAPSPISWPPGCRFPPRCPRASTECSMNEPAMIEHERQHYVACFLYGGVTCDAATRS